MTSSSNSPGEPQEMQLTRQKADGSTTYTTEAWRILIALCMGFFMILLDQTIVTVALPDIQRHLQVENYSLIIWISSAYLLTYAVPLLVSSRMGDKFGAKKMYIIGMATFTIASLVCGLAANIHQLIVFRAIQGLGAGLMTPQTMSIITRVFPPAHRGKAMGIWGAVAGLATLTGPVLGGLLTDLLNWSWIFYINVPIGILTVVLVMKWVPELPTTMRHFDIPGVILSMASIFAIVFALQQAEDAQWAAWIWALLSGGLVALALFIYWEGAVEKKGQEPLIPLSIFKNRSFSLGNISITAMGFCIGGSMIPIMLFVQDIHGYNALQAGLLLTPSAIISGALSPYVGSKTDTVSPRLLSQIGFGTMLISLSVFIYMLTENMNPLWLLVPAAIQGISNAFIWSPNSATTMRSLHREQAGAASGIYNTTRQVGAVLGSAAIATILQAQIMGNDAAANMGISLLLPAIAILLGFIAVSFFPKQVDFETATSRYTAND